MTLDEPFILILGIITGVLALIRLVRLIIVDTFPPADWFINKVYAWLYRRHGEHWAKLITCPWCVTPYVVVPAVAWFALMTVFPSWTALVWAWFIVTGWASTSLVVSLAVVPLIPDDED